MKIYIVMPFTWYFMRIEFICLIYTYIHDSCIIHFIFGTCHYSFMKTTLILSICDALEHPGIPCSTRCENHRSIAKVRAKRLSALLAQHLAISQ